MALPFSFVFPAPSIMLGTQWELKGQSMNRCVSQLFTEMSNWLGFSAFPLFQWESGFTVTYLGHFSRQRAQPPLVRDYFHLLGNSPVHSRGETRSFGGRKRGKKNHSKEFPGGLVVRITGFHCCGLGSVAGRGTEIPQATWHGQKISNGQLGGRGDGGYKTSKGYGHGVPSLPKILHPKGGKAGDLKVLVGKNMGVRVSSVPGPRKSPKTLVQLWEERGGEGWGRVVHLFPIVR